MHVGNNRKPAPILLLSFFMIFIVIPLANAETVAVSQFGFHSSSPKKVISYSSGSSGNFNVLDSSGQAVFTGTLEKPKDFFNNNADCQGGQACLVGDFSSFSRAGNYALQTSIGGKSQNFEIRDDAYSSRVPVFLEFFNAMQWQNSAYHADWHAGYTPPFTINADGAITMDADMAATTLIRLGEAYNRNPSIFGTDKYNILRPGTSDMLEHIGLYADFLASLQDYTPPMDVSRGYVFTGCWPKVEDTSKPMFNNEQDPCVAMVAETRNDYTVVTLLSYLEALPALNQLDQAKAKSFFDRAVSTYEFIKSNNPNFNANEYSSGFWGASLFWLYDYTKDPKYLEEAHSMRAKVSRTLFSDTTRGEELYWEQYIKHKGAIISAGLEYDINGDRPENIISGKLYYDYKDAWRAISKSGEKVFQYDNNIQFQNSRYVMLEAMLALKAYELNIMNEPYIKELPDNQLAWLAGMNRVQLGDPNPSANPNPPLEPVSFIFGIGKFPQKMHLRLLDASRVGEMTFTNGLTYIPGWVNGAFDSDLDSDSIFNYYDSAYHWFYTESSSEMAALGLDIASYLDARYNNKAPIQLPAFTGTSEGQTPPSNQQPPGAPTGYLHASSNSINAGDYVTLTWSVQNADTVSISPDVGNVGQGGGTIIQPMESKTYILSATNSAGTSRFSAQVNVASASGQNSQGQDPQSSNPPSQGSNQNTPIGWFDEITEAGVMRGWSVDKDHPADSIQVHVYIDGPAGSGTLAGAADANAPRPDVNSAEQVTGNHGFNFVIPNTYRDGNTHSAWIYGIDKDDPSGNSNRLLSGAPKQFRIAPPASGNQQPIGWLDFISDEGIANGWALDKDHPDQPILVRFFVDGPAGVGTSLLTVNADASRPDVNNVLRVNGDHGFKFSIPGRLRDDKTHQLYAYGVDKDDATGNSDTLLSGAPKSFRFSASSNKAPDILSCNPRNSNLKSGETAIIDYTITDLENDPFNVKIDWGDGETTETSASSSASHKYSKDGNFKIKISAKDSRGSQSSESSCGPISVAASTQGQTCYSTMESIPSKCNGGTISEDKSDGCRSIKCESGENSLAILACNKPDTGAKQYFEMYRQSSSGFAPLEICLADVCVGKTGYAKSGNYPVCAADQPPSGESCNGISGSITCNGQDGLCNFKGGQTVSIAWNSNGADSCSVIAPGWQGTSGKFGTTPGNTETFTLRCSKSGNSCNVDSVTAKHEDDPNPPPQQQQPSASVEIAEWYPKGKDYVFKCVTSNFVATLYDWIFGDGSKLVDYGQQDVFHTFSNAGSFTVECTAKNPNSQIKASKSIQVQ